MPLHGPLSEFPLSEIFNMVGHSTGALLFPEQPLLEVHLKKGHLISASFDGLLLNDTLQLQDALCHVETSHHLFEFSRLGADKLQKTFSISIAAVLMQLACYSDEIVLREPFLPQASLNFVLARKGHTLKDHDLELFLNHSGSSLTIGANAESIAHQSRLSLDRVRFCLLKLREAGVIIERQLASIPVEALKMLLIEPSSTSADQIKLRLGKALPLVAVAPDLLSAKMFLGGNFKFDVVVSNLPTHENVELVQWSRSIEQPPLRFFRLSKDHSPSLTYLPKGFGLEELQSRLPRAIGTAD